MNTTNSDLSKEGANDISLKDQLLKRASEFDSGKRIDKAIQESDEASNPKVIAFFMSVLRKADELGVRRFSFDRSTGRAKEEWLSFSLSEMETELQNWAKEGDTIASQILAELEQFKNNVLLWDFLWQVAINFFRPCWSIRNYGKLSSFLRVTAEKGLAQVLTDPNYIPKNGILIKTRTQNLVYLPKKDTSVSEAGWPFAKEAEIRAKIWAQEQQGRIEDLEEQSTNLTPAKVKNGYEGRMFVRVGINRGVLLEVRNEDKIIMLRVLKAVGVYVDIIPSNWISWDAKEDDWPSNEIFNAIKAWETRIIDAQNRNKRIHSVLCLATLPTTAKEKALTLLFSDEEQQSDVAAFCINRFQWPYGSGPIWSLGLALGQNGGVGRLKVIEIRSTNPTIKQREALYALKDQALPQLFVEERNNQLKVRFQENIEKVDQASYTALLMVKTAIQMRLRLEFDSISEE